MSSRSSPKVPSGTSFVTDTKLPLWHQLDLARSLGATITGEASWVVPEDVDLDEWNKKFILYLRIRGGIVTMAMDKFPQRAKEIWEGTWPYREVVKAFMDAVQQEVREKLK